MPRWGHSYGTHIPGSELTPVDDGVIDELAIELVITGARRVRLTRRERIEAARRLYAAGELTRSQIRDVIGVGTSTMTRIDDALGRNQLQLAG